MCQRLFVSEEQTASKVQQIKCWWSIPKIMWSFDMNCCFQLCIGVCNIWLRKILRKTTSISKFMKSPPWTWRWYFIVCTFVFVWNGVCSHSPRHFDTHYFWIRLNHVRIPVQWHRLLFWVFLITYFKFICPCILINFLMQYRGIYESVVFWFWDSTSTMYYSNAMCAQSRLFCRPLFPIRRNAWNIHTG